MTDIRQEWVDVTPQLAEEWLGRNTHNRPVRKSRVELYAGAMSDGAWLENGETIKWDEDDVLQDGQHRLLAVIRSGCTIRTLVVWGLPVAAQSTLDRHLTRSLGDILTLEGFPRGALLSTAGSFLYKYEHKLLRGEGSRHEATRPDQLKEALDTHPGIDSSIPVGDKISNSSISFSGGVAIALHYLMARLDSELADMFWDGLASGVGLNENEPVFKLREKLIADARQARLTYRHVRYTRAAWAIKAWNATRAGRTIQTLRLASNEAYPVIE